MDGNDSVVVAVFIHRKQPEWFERVSLVRCREIFSSRTVVLVHPRSIQIDAYTDIMPGLRPLALPERWFRTVKTYNRLKLSPSLYRHFTDYSYLLTYELDSFVFGDHLDEWCAVGWDYIGAPWFVGGNNPAPDAEFYGVGNSGFSLRRIPSVLKVLNDWRYVTPPGKVFRDPRWIRHRGVKRWLAMAANVTTRNRFHWAANIYRGNEDFFWGLHADSRFDWWKTADYESARRFSFEHNAPRLFRETGGQLPFGCHKWNELHQDFWRPHLEAAGAELPEGYGR